MEWVHKMSMFKNTFTKYIIGAGTLAIVPSLVFAQDADALFAEVLRIFESVAAFIAALAVLYFLINVLRYAFSNSDTVRAQAKQHILWGLIALLVITFVWGFVAILNQTVFKGNVSGPEDFQQEISTLTDVEKRGSSGVAKAVNAVIDIVAAIIPLLIGLGVLFFLWGVFQYINPENSQKKGQAVAYIGWAVLLLFIMLSVWGFVGLLSDSLGVSDDSAAPSSQKISPDQLIVPKGS